MYQNKKNVAVIMSVYKNDKSDWLRKSIDSILGQTYTNVTIFLAVDGPVSEDIYSLLLKYTETGKVNVYYFDECNGLAARLNILIEEVLASNDFHFVARMDADDISLPTRIEKQVAVLESSNCDVIGSSVIEIDDSGKHLFEKKMHTEHEKLLNNIIIKCPFNHPSVIFRISVFHDGIRYDSSMKNTQDYNLWVELASLGYIFGNVDESLLLFRVSNDFHTRRSFNKAKNDLYVRIRAMRELKMISLRNIVHSILLYSIRISPSFVSKFAYRYFR
ncbi:glycosyltransferase [Aeromonas caviae]|uniref:glycosyltransferase n=1 Tax=Aeromonas caviae TaxID=648 RepID=UPI003A45879C